MPALNLPPFLIRRTFQRLDAIFVVDSNGHVLVTTGVPDERSSDEDEHDAEHDVAAIQRGRKPRLPRRAGNDDAGNDGDGAGDEATQKGAHAPIERALAHELPGHGGDDAGGNAGEKQGECEDGAGALGDARNEKRVHARQVGVRGVGGERGGGDDEDGGVDEDSDDGERDAELGDGEGHTGFDGFEGRAVVVEGGSTRVGGIFVVAVVLDVKLPHSSLDQA